MEKEPILKGFVPIGARMIPIDELRRSYYNQLPMIAAMIETDDPHEAANGAIDLVEAILEVLQEQDDVE